MENNLGIIVAVAAALFFYLRLIILQRQKVKSLPGKPISPSGKKSRSPRKEEEKTIRNSIPQLNYKYPVLLIIGILLIIAGAVLSAAGWFSVDIRSYWWIPVTLGILLMSIGIQ